MKGPNGFRTALRTFRGWCADDPACAHGFARSCAIRSATRSSCSATSQASPNGSSSPLNYSSVRSAKPRQWHGRPPM